MLNSEKQSKHGLITFKTLTRGNRWLIFFKIGIENRHASRQLESPTQVCFPVNIVKFLRTAFL